MLGSSVGQIYHTSKNHFMYLRNPHRAVLRDEPISILCKIIRVFVFLWKRTSFLIRMEAILQQLLQSPKLSLYVEQLQAALADEKQRRRAFYDWVSENQKAEFINGEIVVHSPVMKRHNSATGLLYQLINIFTLQHNAGFVGIEKTMISLTRNDYEPDICFWHQEKARTFTEDQKLFPAPDWIVEVLSKSTEVKDRGVKFEDYEAHSVTEYWMVDPVAHAVEQYVLQENTYELLLKSDNGTIRSRVLPDFVIPVTAIFDEPENLRTLTQLLK